jgi:hypothetical protein
VRDGQQRGLRMTGPRKEAAVRGVDPHYDGERMSGPCERKALDGKARAHCAECMEMITGKKRKG